LNRNGDGIARRRVHDNRCWRWVEGLDSERLPQRVDVLNERHGLDDLSNERIGNYFCGKAFRNVIDSVVDRQRVHLGSSFYEVSLNCAVIFWALFSFGAVLVVIDVCDSV
jgi:hypothetical protein